MHVMRHYKAYLYGGAKVAARPECHSIFWKLYRLTTRKLRRERELGGLLKR